MPSRIGGKVMIKQQDLKQGALQLFLYLNLG